MSELLENGSVADLRSTAQFENLGISVRSPAAVRLGALGHGLVIG